MNVNGLPGETNIAFTSVTDTTWSYYVKENHTHFPQKTSTSLSQVQIQSRHKLRNIHDA